MSLVIPVRSDAVVRRFRRGPGIRRGAALVAVLAAAAVLASPVVANAMLSEDATEAAFLRSVPDWLVRPPEPSPPEPPPETGDPGPGFLDRLRASFVLDHALERPRVRAEIAWVRRNPDFLARVGPRAERHLAGICEVVLARGMPGELCLLPLIESALNPFARSRSGAVGLWQFIPGTARRYDLKIDWWADERRDPVASTDAALRYLADLHAMFDDWLLAMAAYNCGERLVERRLDAAPDGATFFDLKRLPRETRAYVPRLLAFAAIFADPEAHGIRLPGRLGRNEALAATYAPVTLAGQMDLARAAEVTGLSLEELYRLNPGLKQWATHPAGPHRLLVPAARSEALGHALAQVAPEDRMGWVRHRIVRNETLGHIALRYRTDVATLMRTNDLRRSLIRAGDTLLVPRPGRDGGLPPARSRPRSSGVYVVQAGDSLWEISRRLGVPLEGLMRENAMGPEELLRIGRRLTLPSASSDAAPQARSSGDPARQGLVRYRVRRGDSLDRIAREFGVSVRDIAAWNALDPKAYIFPGQELVLRVGARG
ncbi:MAG: LysM peptidoglycan-binding domain-containing protein [Gammaproteobacteria bacterium]|nr:LysM peptidoglycan-binding domain-containing protein [Gammaproteobacteria bacterium]